VLYGYRTASSSVSQDVQVRLEAPRVSVLSLHQFINLGGAEFVVLRATPADVQAGVKVGDAEYPAYPGTAVGSRIQRARGVLRAAMGSGRQHTCFRVRARRRRQPGGPRRSSTSRSRRRS
jgi:hypothetical protein